MEFIYKNADGLDVVYVQEGSHIEERLVENVTPRKIITEMGIEFTKKTGKGRGFGVNSRSFLTNKASYNKLKVIKNNREIENLKTIVRDLENRSIPYLTLIKKLELENEELRGKL